MKQIVLFVTILLALSAPVFACSSNHACDGQQNYDACVNYTLFAYYQDKDTCDTNRANCLGEVYDQCQGSCSVVPPWERDACLQSCFNANSQPCWNAHSNCTSNASMSCNNAMINCDDECHMW